MNIFSNGIVHWQESKTTSVSVEKGPQNHLVITQINDQKFAQTHPPVTHIQFVLSEQFCNNIEAQNRQKKYRTKNIELHCVFSMFIENNKRTHLRRGSNGRNININEPQPKFTGSYQKSVHTFTYFIKYFSRR